MCVCVYVEKEEEEEEIFSTYSKLHAISRCAFPGRKIAILIPDLKKKLIVTAPWFEKNVTMYHYILYKVTCLLVLTVFSFQMLLLLYN